ncbi:MAG TPA: peroxiredoxin [Ignavibacteria bacterium]|jgi:peroxiredoxin Q/BCP
MKKIFFLTLLLITMNMANSQTELKEGDKAPDFSLQSDEGKWINLSDYKNGSNVVLYFYPKDFTSGCTKQACNFRDNISEIQQNNAVVLGVSVDDADSHKKFKEEYNLNYTLLADPSKIVSTQYSGLRESGLANRVTFIIDKNGIIKKIYPNVDVNENYKEIIEYLKGM